MFYKIDYIWYIIKLNWLMFILDKIKSESENSFRFDCVFKYMIYFMIMID